jgi:hypothetical protein
MCCMNFGCECDVARESYSEDILIFIIRILYSFRANSEDQIG